jgi:uncharacterized repeat protein (TIGR01451 family)
MIGTHRIAALALLTVCAAVWVVVPLRTPAEAQPPGPGSPEPPVVEGVGPGPGVPGGVVDPPPPVVTVRVRVPAQGAAGQELTYRILVENTSRSPAHRVAVRAARPTNAKFERATPKPEQEEPELRWAFGTLAGGASKEITLVVTPDGKGEVQTTARVLFEHGQSVTTHLNRPALRLRKVGPSEAALKTELKYALEVTNDGSAAAEDVEVTDVLPEGLTYSESRGAKEVDDKTRRWEFPSLAAGQSRRIDYTLIAAKEGTFTNKATAAARGVAAVEATATVAVGRPKLAVTKAGPPVGDLGQPLTYTITVQNTGTVAANNVEILDKIPPDRTDGGRPSVEFLGATVGGRYEQPFVRWRVGRLAAGASREVRLTLRVNQVGTLTNVAEVAADQVPPESAESATLIIDPSRRLVVNVDRPREGLQVDRKSVYVVRVINPSRNAPVDGATLTFSAPANVRVVEARGATGDKPETDKPPLRFAPIQRLAPRQIAEYFITLEPTQAGEAKFTVTAESNPPLAGLPVTVDIKATVNPSRQP